MPSPPSPSVAQQKQAEIVNDCLNSLVSGSGHQLQWGINRGLERFSWAQATAAKWGV
jgi:hypothetical protein